MLQVPFRPGGGFPLMAESDEEKKEWMSTLRNVIEGPVVALEDAPRDEYTTYEDEREHTTSFSKLN